ncbi:MAG: Hpt domain-containing protein [Phycisphaerales bacterium]|nr:Hpt domain-containing protein [Phycisphaerales bacterium]
MTQYDQARFSLDVTDSDDVELIEMFLGELPKRMEMLSNAAESGDFSHLNRLAHQLKGAAPGFGFDPIGEAAASLELRLKTSNLDMVELEHIREEFDLLMAECNSYMRFIKN